VQVNKGTDKVTGENTVDPSPIRYLGPTIIAERDRPVRIKFTNKLPTGQEGDLFIPVDTTVMGAGAGPTGEMYTENRATLHLHGGKSPWISDGTPHQWITPAGEDTPYPKGVSVRNVPDMPDPGDGSQTFFYTNQQSARFMFYHDHSFGITRLNVYAGEAAGYFIQDPVEQDLVNRGIIPSDQIPLIVQDKSFVDAATVRDTDPTWNWGSGAPDANGIRPVNTGDLWWPHVYMPAQNPEDITGVNAMGRWHYGPWFWPPTQNIAQGPVPNPYYDPINAPWEPTMAPGTPDNSMGMESFLDTSMVNGTAYPSLTVDPKAYRFRILNASNDRFFNLQMYTADPSTLSSDGRTDTEVKMVPAQTTPGFPQTWPTDGRAGGVPDPATVGPDWIQIGSESGFLPAPAVVPNQPITWNNNPTTFNAGNVELHSLLLG
jgi:FtsP/CotA-like multicopper oxidase with cupredoxin domain